MLNNIAIWGGIIGMAVALLALLLMVFAKKDIADMLNRDVILFDQNFAVKKQAIEKALKLLDDLEQTPELSSNPEFVKLAKQSYNELLCVMTRQQIAEQFKTLALESGTLTADSLAKFKFDCRKDIGFKTKYVKQAVVLPQVSRPQMFGSASAASEPEPAAQSDESAEQLKTTRRATRK